MSQFYKSGTAESAVVKDNKGIVEPVQLSSDTTLYGNSAPINLFNSTYAHSRNRWLGGNFGTVAQVKPNFTDNAVWGPNSRYCISGGLGGEPGLQLPTKAALDASLTSQGFDLTSPISFEMIVVFAINGPPILFLDAGDGTVAFDQNASAPIVANNHEQWRFRLLKSGGAWSQAANWVVEAVRTPRLPIGFTYSPKVVGTAAALSGDPLFLMPEYYIQISDASANFVLPTFAAIEAHLGEMGISDAQKAWISWRVRFHNDDGVNALTFAGAAGVTADTNSVVAIPANGTGFLCLSFTSGGTAAIFYVI